MKIEYQDKDGNWHVLNDIFFKFSAGFPENRTVIFDTLTNGHICKIEDITERYGVIFNRAGYN